MRVAINGLGRIGRATFKILVNTPKLELVAINDPAPADQPAYLLNQDTVYGRYHIRTRADRDAIAMADPRHLMVAEHDLVHLGSRQDSEPMKHQNSFGHKSIILSMIYSILIGGSVLGELRISLAADVFQSPPAPEKREDVPSSGSALPSEKPEKRPSIDPGIVIHPPVEPHPDSVVDPPVIDPDMSIHPQDAPTTEKPSHQTPLPSEPPEKTPTK